jgi:hypothetical protein
LVQICSIEQRKGYSEVLTMIPRRTVDRAIIYRQRGAALPVAE